MKHIWLHYTTTDLATEWLQLQEEGRDTSSLQSEYEALILANFDDPAVQTRFHHLMDVGQTLPYTGEMHGKEPDTLEGIRALRPASRPVLGPVQGEIHEKLEGAWLGRAAGCLLGKPLEGFRSRLVDPILIESGNLPLHRYLHSSDADGGWDRMFGDNKWSAAFLIDRVDGMPEDDDMNYTTTGLAIASAYGRDFTPQNVADFWLDNIPVLRTCTAERVAYRNFVNGVAPPASAAYRNPYREWIGAQIRADFWGYLNPGKPELAAEMAWRDASISHIKNGIYGEMWAAAMVAAAFTTTDVFTILEAGLGEIPAECRLTEAVRLAMKWHRDGHSFEAAKQLIRDTYDEEGWHSWTHTITNAVVVTVGLLWGEGDFGLSICRAVEPLYDTDCNGATVGSIIGAAYGRAHLPEVWTAPLRDSLTTGVKGFERVSLTGMAARTAALLDSRKH